MKSEKGSMMVNADTEIELDDLSDDDPEAMQLIDEGVDYDNPWSEEDEEDTVPDNLEDDGEE